MKKNAARKLVVVSVLLLCVFMAGCGCGKKKKDPVTQQGLKISITPEPSPAPEPDKMVVLSEKQPVLCTACHHPVRLMVFFCYKVINKNTYIRL